MLETVMQFIKENDLWNGDWQIFYAGVVLTFLVWLIQWSWKRFTQKLPVFEGDIYDLNFPTSDNKLIGRENVMKSLDQAWEDQNTRLMIVVAGPGTGKTILVKNWLEQLKLYRDEKAVERIYCWSFQNQGTENKYTASSDFFRHALEFFKSDRGDFSSEYYKGVYLAKLINTQRTLVVLDGLEVFQPWHHNETLRGTLNDNAITGLLKTLAMHNSGLCLVTMREPLDQKIAKIEYGWQYSLKNLSIRAAVQLLKSKGVRGKDAELEQVVQEYKGHAYSLNLLATYLHQNYQGDIRQRDRLPNIMHCDETSETNWHIQQVMQAYADSLEGHPELAQLYFISLFDQVVGKDIICELIRALAQLYQTPIRKLAAKPLLQSEIWASSCKTLQSSGLLLDNDTEWLDLHPLVRGFFRGEFQTKYPSLWKRSHIELYEYYKALPEVKQPDTLKSMRPLFHSVAHGCAAGLHQQALDEVYWPSIQRYSEGYIVKKFGAFSDDLALIEHFFNQPWSVPVVDLTEDDQASVLNRASFDLYALGRLGEALGPVQESIEMRVKQKNWGGAAQNAENLSEMQLVLGQLSGAVASGERSVGYADQSGDLFHRMSGRATHADALHQVGQSVEAFALFVEMEQFQGERQPMYPRLYSLSGFQYCDLLLAQGSIVEVLERAEYALDISLNAGQRGIGGMGLSDIALDQLSLGRAHHVQNDLSVARNWLGQAVEGLREAGYQDLLPRGLLARAALWRDLGEETLAQQDLDEVWEIAEPSGMRLFMTDYHLEMARLLLKNPMYASTKERTLSLADHINAAESLINETGYHRRDAELVALKTENHPLTTKAHKEPEPKAPPQESP